MRSYQQIPTRSASSLSSLHEHFRVIDLQNRELIKLAQNIHRSSFMPNQPLPPIIQKFQEELRISLSMLIEGIRQVFIDTDRKLRSFVQMIEQQPPQRPNSAMSQTYQEHFQRQNFQRPRENTVYIANHNSVDPYSSLIERISHLEISLKNTQQNEARLVSMIQKLQKRSQQHPIQINGIRNHVQSKIYRGNSNQSLEKSKLSNQSQSTFRLFSLNQQQNKNISADKRSVRPLQKNRTLPQPFTCFNQGQPNNLEPSKIDTSIIQPTRSASRIPLLNFEKSQSNHSHRLNFMVNTLNS